MTPENVVIAGDCVEVMADLEPESVDAIVTDPPYNLTDMGRSLQVRTNLTRKDLGPNQRRMSGGFMGKSWDGSGVTFRRETWEAAYRVAKPSAYLLAFGGTRTVHRMTVALEDAGWIIRDMLVWAYASGFPKSKASLKPAWEPIVMARKPGPLRMLAIDECRIPTDDELNFSGNWGMTPDRGWNANSVPPRGRIIRRTAQPADVGTLSQGERPVGEIASANPAGRWPANVILTDPIFDGGTPGVIGGESEAGSTPARTSPNDVYQPLGGYEAAEAVTYDRGGVSRFFLVPKAAKTDREPVVRGQLDTKRGGAEQFDSRWKEGPGELRQPVRENTHPTVKPTELMRHLVRLVTPTGGLVLDPFLGSGSTALAAEREGFRWLGIEKEPEYVAIAEARLNGTQRGMGLVG